MSTETTAIPAEAIQAAVDALREAAPWTPSDLLAEFVLSAAWPHIEAQIREQIARDIEVERKRWSSTTIIGKAKRDALANAARMIRRSGE